MIRVVVVEDHDAVREEIVAALAEDPDLEIAGSYADVDEVLGSLWNVAPDLVLIDDRLPGGRGSETCRIIRQRASGTRVIVLASFPREEIVIDALAAGATGVVLKETGLLNLHEAIQAVTDGGVYIDPRVAGRIVSRALEHDT